MFGRSKSTCHDGSIHKLLRLAYSIDLALLPLLLHQSF